MSSEDQVRPYHAKDAGHGQEAADAVAAVLKHAAERKKAAELRPRPKRQPKWMLPVGINLAVLAVYLLIAPPRWVTVNPIEPPDLASQETSLKVAMYFQAQRIESYRMKNGVAPVNLSDAGSAVPEIDYIRRGDNEYQLVATVGDSAVVYDSTEPDASFAEAAATRLSGG
ncbi:MAG TPA: hypothetical protein VJ997_02410 [Longimicrobiales bacterium]|nr:hypothetical protein [Longimicrobiales bacterium]